MSCASPSLARSFWTSDCAAARPHRTRAIETTRRKWSDFRTGPAYRRSRIPPAGRRSSRDRDAQRLADHVERRLGEVIPGRVDVAGDVVAGYELDAQQVFPLRPRRSDDEP